MSYVHNDKYDCSFCTDGKAYSTVEYCAQASFASFAGKSNIDVNNIVIVGAHEGPEIAFMLNNYPNATIYAFEPMPNAYNNMNRYYGQNSRVKLFNTALMDYTGTAKLYQLSNSPSSSLLEFQAAEMGHIHYITDTYDVPVTTLDSITELVGKTIDYMQIDVQGAELFVLKGATNILNNTSVLMLEVKTEDYVDPWDAPDFDMYKGMCRLDDLVKYLAPLNIKCISVGLDNEAKNGQGNSIWINRNIARVRGG